MAYADLDPIRAGMAETLETSDYTSIQQRILEQEPEIAKPDSKAAALLPEDLQSAIGKLMSFSDERPKNPERAIPYELYDYLELVDWSGRAIVPGKRGNIPADLPPILERLNINPEQYVRFISRTDRARFRHFIGPVEAMRELAARFGRRFLKGQTAAAQLFSPG
jgi:hypothetical protein